MPTETDSWDAKMPAVRAFHDKHGLRENGGEELTYRVALMAEELGSRVSAFRDADGAARHCSLSSLG